MNAPRVARPLLLQIEITSHCNLKCKMCPLTLEAVPSSLRPGHVQEMTWQHVRELARVMGRVNLTGYGEPLANPRFLTYLRELDDLGVKTGFATNGALLTPGFVAELAGLRHLVHVNVSIDSPDPATYHFIRGGDVAKALAGLRILAAALRPPKRVSVSSVVIDRNLESLTAFPRLLASLGVKEFLLQGLIDWNPAWADEHLARSGRLPGPLRQIEDDCKTLGIRLELQPDQRLDLELSDPEEALRRYHGHEPLTPTRTKQCCVPWDLPFINKDGQVFPCCYSDETALMGDLREQSFDAIWQGEPFGRFRADLLSGTHAPTVCRRCNAVPTGPHPLNEYAATILLKKSVLRGRMRLKLLVRNTGLRTWTQATRLRIGTAEPRDRESMYFHTSWISPTRVATFREESVAPGEVATFPLVMTPDDAVKTEEFQLLVEGVCWLPDTCFTVRPRYHLLDDMRQRLRPVLAGWRAGSSEPA